MDYNRKTNGRRVAAARGELNTNRRNVPMPRRIFREHNNLQVMALNFDSVIQEVLTTGKPCVQAESLPRGSDALTRPYVGNGERLLRLRWLALMMELAPDIGRYANEFKKTVLLLDGQSDPAAQECDLAQVCYLDCPNLVFSYFPKEHSRVSESHLSDLA